MQAVNKAVENTSSLMGDIQKHVNTDKEPQGSVT